MLKLLRSYLKRHYTLLLLPLLWGAVFALVFYLYALPAEAVLYALTLCLALGAVFFGIGWGRYCHRHRQLTALRARVAVTIDGLPPPRDMLEADYQALLRALEAEKRRIAAVAEREQSQLTEYYSRWAHQIKTPIAAMHLLLSAEESRAHAELDAELFKIEQYAEMVLQYLRLGSASTDYVLKRYALDDIVRGSLRKYARLFILKKVRLDFRASGLTALTDEKWLAFVIEQLLSNALKYTAAGSISLYAEGETLVIEDTGLGIRAEDLPRVFEPGFTGYNGRIDQKSTGIGLYLCKRVCDRLGHGLALESTVGRGTRARLDLAAPPPVTE